MTESLQWGGRFAGAPDQRLLDFASSLEEDLVLAAFDVRCSLAHVEALRGGGIVAESDAAALVAALRKIESEIDDGSFAQRARSSGAEDVHGAIDGRVRALAGVAGERLHAGRSRNDQVATTLLLYVRERAARAAELAHAVATRLTAMASAELEAGTLLAGCTHRQPAQPVLLAFVLAAWSEPFLRAIKRFARVGEDSRASCPLGSAALAGSSLPLDRERSARALDFAAPSRNALDAIGNRDVALDLAHACVRVAIDASRIAEEIVTWCAPAYGFVRLGDAASTGSSLMPQKRNPDPFELVRARAATLSAAYAGALGTLCGLAPSYQRDLQETKGAIVGIVERSLNVLDGFGHALEAVEFNREAMSAAALEGYTVATDVADALIAVGVEARKAHACVGVAVRRAESQGRDLHAGDLCEIAAAAGLDTLRAPLDPRASVEAKRSAGSTAPADVAEQLRSLEADLRLMDMKTQG